MRDAAGNLLLDQPSAGLLAARPSVPGYDCGNAPLARAVAVDATLGVLLVEASQWPAADACPTSRLYAVYRFARRPENR